MALPKPTPPVSESDRLTGNLIFVVVAVFIFYLFNSFLKFILSPFKVVTLKEAAEKVNAKIGEKRIARWKRQLSDPNDPMAQFHLRFVEKPDEYKGDADNEPYYAWFKEWKAGNIIDSDLRWAPSVFDDELEIRPNFIHYMKIQLDLHKKASLVSKMRFFNTISKYYPELSATLRGLEEDLAQYDAELDEAEAEKVLQEEIQAFGLPKDIAEYLAYSDLNAKGLRDAALYFKECIEAGASSDIAVCAFENRIKINESSLQIIGHMERLNLPDELGIEVLKGNITPEQLIEIADQADSYRDLYDDEPDEEFYNDILMRYRGKKLLKKL